MIITESPVTLTSSSVHCSKVVFNSPCLEVLSAADTSSLISWEESTRPYHHIYHIFFLVLYQIRPAHVKQYFPINMYFSTIVAFKMCWKFAKIQTLYKTGLNSASMDVLIVRGFAILRQRYLFIKFLLMFFYISWDMLRRKGIRIKTNIWQAFYIFPLSYPLCPALLRLYPLFDIFLRDLK